MPPSPLHIGTERLHIPVPREAIRGRRPDLTPHDAARQLAPTGDAASQPVTKAARERLILECRRDHAARLHHGAAAVYSAEL